MRDPPPGRLRWAALTGRPRRSFPDTSSHQTAVVPLFGGPSASETRLDGRLPLQPDAESASTPVVTALGWAVFILGLPGGRKAHRAPEHFEEVVIFPRRATSSSFRGPEVFSDEGEGRAEGHRWGNLAGAWTRVDLVPSRSRNCPPGTAASVEEAPTRRAIFHRTPRFWSLSRSQPESADAFRQPFPRETAGRWSPEASGHPSGSGQLEEGWRQRSLTAVTRYPVRTRRMTAITAIPTIASTPWIYAHRASNATAPATERIPRWQVLRVRSSGLYGPQASAGLSTDSARSAVRA